MANPSTNSTEKLELLILETKFKLYVTCYMPKNSWKKAYAFILVHRIFQIVQTWIDNGCEK
jgi:predicted DNA-binding protein (UPF0278 family)